MMSTVIKSVSLQTPRVRCLELAAIFAVKTILYLFLHLHPFHSPVWIPLTTHRIKCKLLTLTCNSMLNSALLTPLLPFLPTSFPLNELFGSLWPTHALPTLGLCVFLLSPNPMCGTVFHFQCQTLVCRSVFAQILLTVHFESPSPQRKPVPLI